MIITIGRKPFKGNVCENIESNQCGGFNIKDVREGHRYPSNFIISSKVEMFFPYTETHAGTYRKESHCVGTSFTVTRPKGAVTSKGNSGRASRYYKRIT